MCPTIMGDQWTILVKSWGVGISKHPGSAPMLHIFLRALAVSAGLSLPWCPVGTLCHGLQSLQLINCSFDFTLYLLRHNFTNKLNWIGIM